jgi:hypothetical protein
MEIVIAAVVVALGLAAGLLAAAHLLAKRMPGGLQGGTREPSARVAEPQRGGEQEALARSAEMGRQEERLLGREGALDQRAAEVERMAEAGELPGRRIGEEWRFSRRAVLDWLASANDEGA